MGNISISYGTVLVTLVTGVQNRVTAITFNCATIHSPAVYNIQRHQRPVPLIQYLDGVDG